jgi:hypothetical protein
MLKSIAIATAIAGGQLLVANVASAQQSLQSMHTRIPAPPTTAAAAPAWLTSPEVATLRKQLKDQRAFVEKLQTNAATANQSGGLANAGGIDFQRAQRDPAYAKEIQAKIATMSQAEQMALAMEMSKATQQHAVKEVVAMSRDPEAVKVAADHYADYQMKQATGGITAQYAAVGDIQQKVSARAMTIAEKATKALKCSDGEGGCASKADEAADKATLKAAFNQIIAEYDKALVSIGAQVEAARKARLADIAMVQKDLAATQYGAAAQSSANRQILAAYHNTALIEVEQLFTLSEDASKWAAVRYKDRTINFMPID